MRRFAFESAHARAVAQVWALEPEQGVPPQLVRQLLDAAEELLAGSIPWEWPSTQEAIHPTGFGQGPDKNCGECAWLASSECIQVKSRAGESQPFSDCSPACSRWEPRGRVEDCVSCGACCREGYTFAPVEPDESVGILHPGLVSTTSDGMRRLGRPDGLCIAIDRPVEAGRYPCSIYADRPRACADLAPGSLACLVARKRVGLSR
ncbi:MAG: YkgJ family cysteine cluster protein [Fibrobacterota bacterium]|nr:MAG: YkgJ family cysteine cluster protein [Fibrobacterota bacterium]